MQTQPRASISFQKLKLSTLTQTLRHNARAHDTLSQVHNDFRFAQNNPRFNNSDLEARGYGGLSAIEKAKSLAKRKDANVAFCFSMQVGNYDFWRDNNGMPKKPFPIKFNDLIAAAVQTIKDRFGALNIATVDLHLDETVPHVQIIAVPIKNNKLQSKDFVGGKSLADAKKNVENLRNEFLLNVEKCCKIEINREKVVKSGEGPDLTKYSFLKQQKAKSFNTGESDRPFTFYPS